MKTLDMTKATAPLAEYAQKVRDEPVIVTQAGKPVAVLVSIDGDDLESTLLSMIPRFLQLIERSRAQLRAGQGISSADLRRELGLKPKARRRRQRPKG